MAFGAFAPLPLRLGGTAVDGWTPEQHARMASDVAAMYSTKCFAWLTYSKSGGTVTVESYSGRNGIGPDSAPVPTVEGDGEVTWTWPASWVDEAGLAHVLAFRHARASSGSGAAPIFAHIVSASGRTCRVLTTNADTNAAEDARVTLRVWSPEKRRREHYGGADDKRTSRLEGAIPYAWGWYQHFQSARGSAYRAARDGMIHAENLGLAREEAAISRAAEKLRANSIPGTSDERLQYWATVQSVTVRPTDLPEDVRSRCKARYRLAQGPSLTNLEGGVSALLGSAFVRLWTTEGASLSAPPAVTYWPGVNPGPASYDLGSGTWTSSRAHLVVETQRPPGMTQPEYLELMNTHLFELLDNTMPSDKTFNWAENVASGGFILDVSQMDFVGMT